MRASTRTAVLAMLAAAAVMISPQAAAQDNAGADANATRLPEIRVIGTAPVPPPRAAPRPAAAAATPASGDATSTSSGQPAAQPGAVDRDKIPANVQTMAAPAFDPAVAPSLLDALVRGLPGVALSDQTGNQFQLDLNYRGFVASPVIGTPQGLAVYQNGVRINEAYGDVVNWAFIPEMAIDRMALVPSNPIFGLNAIGGALTIDMKNGYTYRGIDGEITAGSYGRAAATV